MTRRIDDLQNPGQVRRAPSLQLVRSPDHRDLDLNMLADQGVELVGRLVGISGGYTQFSGSLASIMTGADLKQLRFLDRPGAWSGRPLVRREFYAPS